MLHIHSHIMQTIQRATIGREKKERTALRLRRSRISNAVTTLKAKVRTVHRTNLSTICWHSFRSNIITGLLSHSKELCRNCRTVPVCTMLAKALFNLGYIFLNVLSFTAHTTLLSPGDCSRHASYRGINFEVSNDCYIAAVVVVIAE